MIHQKNEGKNLQVLKLMIPQNVNETEVCMKRSTCVNYTYLLLSSYFKATFSTPIPEYKHVKPFHMRGGKENIRVIGSEPTDLV